jgi:hypothetical protein
MTKDFLNPETEEEIEQFDTENTRKRRWDRREAKTD